MARDPNADPAGLLDGALHELREPATTLRSFMEQLLDEPAATAGPARARLERAHGAAVRVLGLVDALRPFARIGRLPPRLEEVDGEVLLARVLVELSVVIAETGVTVTHDPLPTLTTDAERLVLVLHQLFGNAIRFRKADPVVIHVSADPIPEGWRFAVADRGIGIEAAYVERVFWPFERLHAREAYPGHGLGLALCRRIITGLGGRIWAEGRAEGGTRICFSLPAA